MLACKELERSFRPNTLRYYAERERERLRTSQQHGPRYLTHKLHLFRVWNFGWQVLFPCLKSWIPKGLPLQGMESKHLLIVHFFKEKVHKRLVTVKCIFHSSASSIHADAWASAREVVWAYTVGQDPSDSKSNQLHVHIFRFWSFHSFEVYYFIDSSRMISKFPQVLNFNRLFLELKPVLPVHRSGQLVICLLNKCCNLLSWWQGQKGIDIFFKYLFSIFNVAIDTYQIMA